MSSELYSLIKEVVEHNLEVEISHKEFELRQEKFYGYEFSYYKGDHTSFLVTGTFKSVYKSDLKESLLEYIFYEVEQCMRCGHFNQEAAVLHHFAKRLNLPGDPLPYFKAHPLSELLKNSTGLGREIVRALGSKKGTGFMDEIYRKGMPFFGQNFDNVDDFVDDIESKLSKSEKKALIWDMNIIIIKSSKRNMKDG